MPGLARANGPGFAGLPPTPALGPGVACRAKLETPGQNNRVTPPACVRKRQGQRFDSLVCVPARSPRSRARSISVRAGSLCGCRTAQLCCAWTQQAALAKAPFGHVAVPCPAPKGPLGHLVASGSAELPGFARGPPSAGLLWVTPCLLGHGGCFGCSAGAMPFGRSPLSAGGLGRDHRALPWVHALRASAWHALRVDYRSTALRDLPRQAGQPAQSRACARASIPRRNGSLGLSAAEPSPHKAGVLTQSRSARTGYALRATASCFAGRPPQGLFRAGPTWLAVPVPARDQRHLPRAA